MKFLPLTNIGRRLRLKYRVPISALVLASILASLVVIRWFAYWLANVLGIQMDAPSNEQPHVFLYGGLLMGFAATTMCVFYLASFIFIAVVLRLFCGWTAIQIREFIFESRVPLHWFKDEDSA